MTNRVRIDRRVALAGLTAAASGALWPTTLAGQATSTRLILLGTGGGPRPRRTRSAPAQVIVVNGVAYVVDCGDGVARQLVLAGVPLAALRHVFVTHQHSDHNADYGNLLLLAWTAGLRTRVDAWGPPPLAKMTELFLEMNEYDVATRIADEGRVPLAPLIEVHELMDGGVLFEDANVRVTATIVDHPPVVPALAYRFDSPDRSIVISGDTRMSDSLITLARGADVLVHEVYFDEAAVDRLVAGVGNAARLKESVMSHHTSAADAGRVAREAGVKTLVLSHFVPTEDAAITDEMWIRAARTHFDGEVVLGKDLLEI
ncbi:MAG TPA: MBL fold metallo-hydrolase [Gammaproteobacteria bacterium]